MVEPQYVPDAAQTKLGRAAVSRIDGRSISDILPASSASHPERLRGCIEICRKCRVPLARPFCCPKPAGLGRDWRPIRTI